MPVIIYKRAGTNESTCKFVSVRETGLVELYDLHSGIKMVDAIGSTLIFTAEDIKHLTHLALGCVTRLTEIPPTLQYLFIFFQYEGPWPLVQNLFIHERCLEAFIEQDRRPEFYVFSTQKHIHGKKTLGLLADFEIGSNEILEVMDRKIYYNKLTRKAGTGSDQLPESTTPNNVPRLTHAELVALNEKNRFIKYEPMVEEIYQAAYEASLRGEAYDVFKAVQIDSTVAPDVHSWLKTKLPGFHLSLSDSGRIGVSLRPTLIQ